MTVFAANVVQQYSERSGENDHPLPQLQSTRLAIALSGSLSDNSMWLVLLRTMQYACQARQAAEVVCEMRTLLTQDHATNLRDLIINYELDKEGARIIDFTYGKGGLWKTRYPYRSTLTKTDAVPTAPEVYQKNLIDSDYSDLGLHDAAVFDPPYLYGHQAFDYPLNNKVHHVDANKQMIVSMQKLGKNSWASEDRFTQNRNERTFTERIDGLNRIALQCLKPSALLFVKVMDVCKDTELVLNHVHLINHLTNFKCYAIFVYFAGGSKTWRNHAESAHGYWMVFRMTKDTKQEILT